MFAGSDSGGNDGRPDPTKVSTPAEFVDAMRRLKLWTGWGYRQLEKHAAAAGLALPRSTLTVALSRETLPREELVAAFVRACGCDEGQTARWVAARRRIAGAADPVPEPTPASPRRRRRAAWLVRAAVMLVALVVAATITGLVLRVGRSAAPGHGSGAGQAAPDQPDRGRARPGSPATGTPVAPTSTTPPDPGQPSATATNPIVAVTLPAPSVPAPGPAVPNPPTGPTIVNPRPTTPTTPAPPNNTETVRLSDGRTINCPLPYLQTYYGPLGQCTLQSGNQARIVTYSPATRDYFLRMGDMEIDQPTWYDGPTTAEDGVTAPTRGYAIVRTPYGAAVWATQYRDGQARAGIFNVTAGKFLPDSDGAWLPAG